MSFRAESRNIGLDSARPDKIKSIEHEKSIIYR